MPAHKDMSGLVLHGCTILAVSHKDHRSEHFYRCRCHCGKEFTVSGDKLKRGHTKSCGCISDGLKHGLVGTSEYGIWAAMKRRCMNKNSAAYKDYGGRGVVVCERWMHFQNFYADMGMRPSVKHSIDRINNDGNYEPNNCRWTTMDVQARNRRKRKTSRPCSDLSSSQSGPVV